MNPRPDHQAPRGAAPSRSCDLVRERKTGRFFVAGALPSWTEDLQSLGFVLRQPPNAAADAPAGPFVDAAPNGVFGCFVREWDDRLGRGIDAFRSGLFATPTADGDENYFELVAENEAGHQRITVLQVGAGRGSVRLDGGRDRTDWLRRAERAQREAARLLHGAGEMPPPPPLLFVSLHDDGTVVAVDAPPRCSVPVRPEVGLPCQLAELLPLRMAEQIEAHAKVARTNNAAQTFEIARQVEPIDRVQQVRVEPRPDGTLRAVVYDISERSALQQRLHGLAVTDSLTGLANRSLLSERLARAVGRCQRYERTMAVLVLDIDGFSEVNEHHGQAVGDQVLSETARRLNELVRSTDTVGRWDRDAFVFVVEEVNAFEDAEITAQKILGLFEEPFQLGASQMTVTGSIGIAVYPDHGTSADDLIASGHAALERVREAGPSGYCLSGGEPEFQLGQRGALRQEFAGGIERGEFQLVFQPVSRASGRSWVGAEGSVRWSHPERGTLLPSTFVRLAEAAGTMHELDHHILERALGAASHWPELANRRLTVSIKLARQTLRHPELLATLGKLIEQAQVDPRCLEVVVSENVFATAGRPLYRTLRDLRQIGPRLAVGEFGTGSLSLRELRQLSPDRIRIHPQFTSAAAASREGERFCSAIVGLAHGLGAEVVAEGIESQEEEEVMRSLGCDFLQGSRVARPVSAAQFHRKVWDRLSDHRGSGSPSRRLA